MNRFYGVASLDQAAQQARRARAWITGNGQQSESLFESPELALHTMSTGGSVLGRAEADGLHLVCLGMVHGPAPDFGHGSPLDDPDRTANYLLARYQDLGASFLDGLCGHFVVAVVDSASGRLVLALSLIHI